MKHLLLPVTLLLATAFIYSSCKKKAEKSVNNYSAYFGGSINQQEFPYVVFYNDDKIIDTVLPIGQMLTAIGVAVLFGGIVILGIKYMLADPQQKGKLKQQLIGLVVSGVVIFGAFTIWKLTYNFFNGLL